MQKMQCVVMFGHGQKLCFCLPLAEEHYSVAFSLTNPQ